MTMAALEQDGEFDNIFFALRWRGKYQIIQICLLMLLNLPVAFSIMSIIFTGHHIPTRCKEPESLSVFKGTGFDKNISDVNITYSECEITFTSNFSERKHLHCVEGYEYLQPRKLSLAAEWDLVCGKESLVDLLQTCYMFGMGLGSVVFTVLGDKMGRKFGHLTAGLLLCFVVCGMAFIPSYTPFVILKVIQGAAQVGTGLTGVALNLEIVPTQQRSKIGVLGGIIWGICVVVYAVAAYLMRSISWRYHQLVVGITGCYFILLPCFVDESVRWLASMQRYDEVERILRKAARMNGKDEESIMTRFRERILHGETNEKSHFLTEKTPPESSPTDDAGISLTETDRNKDSVENSPISQIFKDKQILGMSAVTWFMWLTNSITYYGLSLTSTKFHSNKYIGFGLNAVMELVSAFAFWFIIDRFGRKKSSLAFHLLAGTSLILSVVFGNFTDTMPSFKAAVTTLSLIGKFAITTSFNILWLYTPELFPTKIRNVGFGLASLSARAGGLLAPFSRTLHQHYPWVPGTIFGSCCIVVALLIRVLPETANCELAQTIQDMKNMLANKGRATQPTHQNGDTKQKNRII